MHLFEYTILLFQRPMFAKELVWICLDSQSLKKDNKNMNFFAHVCTDEHTHIHTRTQELVIIFDKAHKIFVPIHLLTNIQKIK